MSSDDFRRMPSFRWMPLWSQVKSPSLATSERCGHHKVFRFQHQAFRGQVALGSWWQVTNKESEFWMLWNLSVFDCHAPVRRSCAMLYLYSTFWPLPIYFDISFVILEILKNPSHLKCPSQSCWTWKQSNFPVEVRRLVPKPALGSQRRLRSACGVLQLLSVAPSTNTVQ